MTTLKINEYFDLSKVNKEYYLQNVYSNIDNDIERLEKEKQKIESDIATKKNILVQLYADKVTGLLEEIEFNIIKSSNTIEIEKLNVRLSKLDSEMTSLKTDKSKQFDKVKLFEKYRNLSELNKIVLDTFINKIEIGKIDPLTFERPINIDWNLYSA